MELLPDPDAMEREKRAWCRDIYRAVNNLRALKEKLENEGFGNWSLSENQEVAALVSELRHLTDLTEEFIDGTRGRSEWAASSSQAPLPLSTSPANANPPVIEDTEDIDHFLYQSLARVELLLPNFSENLFHLKDSHKHVLQISRRWK